jgi:hypothetical protein
MFRGIDRPCEKIISFLGIEKETWTMSRMWCFKLANDPENSLFAFCSS